MSNFRTGRGTLVTIKMLWSRGRRSSRRLCYDHASGRHPPEPRWEGWQRDLRRWVLDEPACLQKLPRAPKDGSERERAVRRRIDAVGLEVRGDNATAGGGCEL
jgi:hypothetical protein